MSNEQPYSPALQDMTRAHLEALLAAYASATGYSDGQIGKVVQGDPKWCLAFRNRNIGVATYDQSVRRFSAAWPDGLDWPSDVPRQDPSGLDPEDLSRLRARLASRAPSPKE